MNIKKTISMAMSACLYFGSSVGVIAENSNKINAMTFNLRVCIDSGDRSCEARKINVENIINANINEGDFNPSIGKMDFIGFQESDLMWRNVTFNGKTQSCQSYQNISHIAGCIDFSEGLTVVYDTDRWELVDAQRKVLALDDDCKWSSNKNEVCQSGNRMIGMAYFREKDTNQFVYVIDSHGPRAVKWERWYEFDNLFNDRSNKNAPVIALGDFNRGDPLRNYGEYIKVDTDAAGSHNFSNYWGVGTIDYIYYTQGLNLVDQKVIRYPSEWSGDTTRGFASDHYPVWASFEFTGIGGGVSGTSCNASIETETEVTQDVNGKVLINWDLLNNNEMSKIDHFQILNWQLQPLKKNGETLKVYPSNDLSFSEYPEGGSEYHYYIKTVCINHSSSTSEKIIAQAYDSSSVEYEKCQQPVEAISATMDSNRTVKFQWPEVRNQNVEGYVVFNYNLQKYWSEQDGKWKYVGSVGLMDDLLKINEFMEHNVGSDNPGYKGPYIYYVEALCSGESLDLTPENLLKVKVMLDETPIAAKFLITKGYWFDHTSHRFTVLVENENPDVMLHSSPTTTGFGKSLTIVDEDSKNAEGKNKSCQILDLNTAEKQGDCAGLVVQDQGNNTYQIYLQPRLY